MKFIYKIIATLVLIIGMNGQTLATLIISGDGTETCVNGAPLGGGACNVQTISVHSAWQANDPNGNGAQWISYADTGVSGSTLTLFADMTSVFTVTETFFANIGDILTLDVWADDTAEVFLDSISLFAPNFIQGTCAAGAIGCGPGENGMISHTFATAGIHTLSFDVFQVGTGTTNASNPFGLMYSGTLSSVPEPSVLALLGLGILGLGLARRKIK